MKIFIVIVLYRTKLEHSISYISLKYEISRQALSEQIQLIIWDNSPEFNPVQCYHHSGNNIGLTKIYNAMFDEYIERPDSFLMVSDQDTNYKGIDFGSLLGLLGAQNNKEVGVFVPKLYSNGKMVSPGKRFGFIGRRTNNVVSGLTASKNFLAINSGLILNYNCRKVLGKLFDENLQFYGSDTEFFVRYQNYFKYVYVLPYQFSHGLSDDEKVTYSQHSYRTKEKFSSLLYIFRHQPLIYIYAPYFFIKAYFRFALTLLRKGS